MTANNMLKTSLIIGLSLFGAQACVARECTPEEERQAGASGADECTTFTPPERHEGSQESANEDYSSGMDLLVRGDIRNLVVRGGAPAGQVQVAYRPVVDLAQGRSDAQVEATLDELDVSVSSNDEAISVEVERSGESNVGAEMEIRLPDDFDGNIGVAQDSSNGGGEVEFDSVSGAQQLELNLDSLLTTVQLKSPGGLTQVLINSNDEIRTGTFDSEGLERVLLNSQGGDIQTSFGVVPADKVEVFTDGGDLDLGLPGSGDYTMVIRTTGEVDLGNPPGDCETSQNDGGASMTCNAGEDSDDPTFNIRADADVGSDGDVSVSAYYE